MDLRIDEIAGSNKRPWDLMEWVKQRKLPACEAIQYNRQPCHEMDDLWNTLHDTYNSASGREVDLSVLDPLPTLQERDWPPFSAPELTDSLSSCSSRSSPGPDHIMWVHLKAVLENEKLVQLLVTLADACIRVGHWPKHFKDLLKGASAGRCELPGDLIWYTQNKGLRSYEELKSRVSN